MHPLGSALGLKKGIMNGSLIRFVVISGIVIGTGSNAPAQGQLQMQNSPATRFLTNANALGGGSGFFVPADGPFHFEVLTAPSNVTSIDLSLQNLLSSPWSDTGMMGTNTTLAGRERGLDIFQTANFWPVGQTNSFVVVGWSVNLGQTWSDVASGLSGASLVAQNGGYVWEGGSLASHDGRSAFLGATTVGFRQAGGFTAELTIPDPLLFQTGADAQGNPIMTTTTLWVVAPEPSVVALVGVGCAGFALAGRRRC
jgi:hypothetical protein